jgi:hypothetical protein
MSGQFLYLVDGSLGFTEKHINLVDGNSLRETGCPAILTTGNISQSLIKV